MPDRYAHIGSRNSASLSFAWSLRCFRTRSLPRGFSRIDGIAMLCTPLALHVHTKHPLSSLLSLSVFPALNSRMSYEQVQDLSRSSRLLQFSSCAWHRCAHDVAVLQEGAFESSSTDERKSTVNS